MNTIPIKRPSMAKLFLLIVLGVLQLDQQMMASVHNLTKEPEQSAPPSEPDQALDHFHKKAFHKKPNRKKRSPSILQKLSRYEEALFDAKNSPTADADLDLIRITILKDRRDWNYRLKEIVLAILLYNLHPTNNKPSLQAALKNKNINRRMLIDHIYSEDSSFWEFDCRTLFKKLQRNLQSEEYSNIAISYFSPFTVINRSDRNSFHADEADSLNANEKEKKNEFDAYLEEKGPGNRWIYTDPDFQQFVDLFVRIYTDLGLYNERERERVLEPTPELGESLDAKP